MKIALDHHYPPQIADQLRSRGHDVLAAIERGWDREDDEPLLTLCGSEQRVLLTNNVADFAVIARHWSAEGRSHAGLIFTSDASLLRTRSMIGEYVRRLDRLLNDHPHDEDFVDRVHWL